MHLVRQLEPWDFELIDCQVRNDHLASLGARAVAARAVPCRADALPCSRGRGAARGASTTRSLAARSDEPRPARTVRDLTVPRAILRGRRAGTSALVHRAEAGRRLRVGVLGGRIGTAVVVSASDDRVALERHARRRPPPPLPCTLVLALPRPKVLRRVLAARRRSASSASCCSGGAREKSYWQSPARRRRRRFASSS